MNVVVDERVVILRVVGWVPTDVEVVLMIVGAVLKFVGNFSAVFKKVVLRVANDGVVSKDVVDVVVTDITEVASIFCIFCNFLWSFKNWSQPTTFLSCLHISGGNNDFAKNKRENGKVNECINTLVRQGNE